MPRPTSTQIFLAIELLQAWKGEEPLQEVIDALQKMGRKSLLNEYAQHNEMHLREVSSKTGLPLSQVKKRFKQKIAASYEGI